MVRLLKNLMRLAIDPVRERGLGGMLGAIQSCWHARQIERREAFDRRFGTDTDAGWSPSRLFGDGAALPALWRYWPTLEEPFHRVMRAIAIPHRDYVFVDMGSGKGRAMLLASDYPFRRVMGVELAPWLHQAAVDNCRRYRPPTQRCQQLEPLCMDAREFEFPDEPTLLYLFNPFPAEVMAGVIERLSASLTRRPRPFQVAYVNPVCHQQLMDSGLVKPQLSGRATRPGEFDWMLYTASR